MTFHELVNYKWNKKDVPNYRFLFPILKGSNTLNNTGVWSPIELASLYTVPLSAVNGLSRLTTTNNGQTRPIRKFSNWPITVESNRNGRFEFESNLEASQVPMKPVGELFAAMEFTLPIHTARDRYKFRSKCTDCAMSRDDVEQNQALLDCFSVAARRCTRMQCECYI